MPISKPNVTITKKSAPTAQSNSAQKVLLLGGMLSAGSATSGKLVKDISSGDENGLFGAHSMLADMLREFFKLNKKSRVDAIGLSDAESATKAAGVITFSGTATEAGTMKFYVGSTVNRIYELAVTTSMTAAQAATALAALINADATAPFTAAAETAAVTVTMSNAGTEGNATLIKQDDANDVAGLTSTLTAFTGGATNPTMTAVLDVVGDVRYQTICAPYSWGTTYLSSFLDDRFNADNAVLDGRAVVCYDDTFGNAKTALAALNSKSLVVFVDKIVSDDNHKGPAIAEFNINKAVQFCAIRALRLTEGADISDYVTTSVGALDTTGGPAISSLPYFNTPMVNFPVVDESYPCFTQEEADELRDLGGSVWGNNVAGSSVICSEVVTTYKTDSSGATDTTWKYLETVDTASAVGEYMFNNLKSDYSQCRLTDGDLVAGRAMANAGSVSASFTGYYSTLSSGDYVLTRAGEAALVFFKKNLAVSINISTGKITASMVCPLVGQVRAFAVPITMSLGVIGA